MDQYGRPEVIVIGFCNSALPELQYLRAEISKSCSVLVMDLGRWQASLAAEVDIAPSEWILKDSDERLSSLEFAALSKEVHCDLVAANAIGWLKAMLSKFDGVICLGGSTLETATCSRIIRDALPVEFPKLFIPRQASDGSTCTVTGTDGALKSLLWRAAGAIARMAVVEREINGDKKTTACELATVRAVKEN